MKIKPLDNFLGCCDLEVGANIIGFIGLLSSICNILSGLLGGFSDTENISNFIKKKYFFKLN